MAGTNNQVPKLSISYLQALATSVIVYNGIQSKSHVSVIYPGGYRGEIVIPPAVIDGTIAFTIRKYSITTKTTFELEVQGVFNGWTDVSFNKPSAQDFARFLTVQDLTRLESFEVELLNLKRDGAIRDFLENCVLYKRNIIISSKTGSGKTTVARSL
ncbi:MAG: type IV secretion system protein VirB10 [Candidatus Tokpelaia sp. JSC189]|nr:MAG: type IV secretion system protein VirB10 [Candidatus Tokpelaia sp. JSC189]